MVYALSKTFLSMKSLVEMPVLQGNVDQLNPDMLMGALIRWTLDSQEDLGRRSC